MDNYIWVRNLVYGVLQRGGLEYYIGRGTCNESGLKQTPLENQFYRQDLNLYRKWLFEQIKKENEVYKSLKEMTDEFKKGRNIILYCFCTENIGRFYGYKPTVDIVYDKEVCHGEIIAKAILWLTEKTDGTESC